MCTTELQRYRRCVVQSITITLVHDSLTAQCSSRPTTSTGIAYTSFKLLRCRGGRRGACSCCALLLQFLLSGMQVVAIWLFALPASALSIQATIGTHLTYLTSNSQCKQCSNVAGALLCWTHQLESRCVQPPPTLLIVLTTYRIMLAQCTACPGSPWPTEAYHLCCLSLWFVSHVDA